MRKSDEARVTAAFGAPPPPAIAFLHQPAPNGPRQGQQDALGRRGADINALEAPATPPPPLGLRRTDIDIPTGMKTKLYAGGMELTNRTVRLIVCELSDEAYLVRREGLMRVPPSDRPRPPHLRDERGEFRRGAASGVRLTSFHVESGLAVMSTYVLDRPCRVELGVFARGNRGCDVARYEHLLETVRPKA